MAKKVDRTIHYLPITQARINLGQVVKRVYRGGECFVLEKDGIPVAGVVDLDSLEDILELEDPIVKKRIAASARDDQKRKTRKVSEFLFEQRVSLKSKRKAA